MPKRLLWLALVALVVFIGRGSLFYVLSPSHQLDVVFRAKYMLHHGTVVAHGIFSVFALVLGPWLFVARTRLHRFLGYAYILCLLGGALTGLSMSLRAEGGWLGRAGFVFFDLLWLATAVLALQRARQRKFAEHRRWMVRSYALTFGAALLRLYLYGLQWLGYEFNAIYPYISWLSWTTSLALAELILEGESHVRLHSQTKPVAVSGRPLHPRLHSGGHSPA